MANESAVKAFLTYKLTLSPQAGRERNYEHTSPASEKPQPDNSHSVTQLTFFWEELFTRPHLVREGRI